MKTCTKHNLYAYLLFAGLLCSQLFAPTRTLGQVGIGTNTPDGSAVLELSSTTRGFLPPRMTAAQMNGIASPAEGLVVFNTTENRLFIYRASTWQPVGMGTFWEMNGNILSGTEFIGSTNAQPLRLFTDNTERVRVTAAGNVGIGTTAPNAALQFANGHANRQIVLWEDANDDHQYYGLGINTSTLRYQVSNVGANHVFFAGAGSTSSQELMRIQGDGNVGIGIATPTQRLDVGGSVRFTGALMPNGSAGTTDQVLTSQGAGVPPTWQSASVLGDNLGNHQATAPITTTLASGNILQVGNDAWLSDINVADGIGVHGSAGTSGSIRFGNLSAVNNAQLLGDASCLAIFIGGIERFRVDNAGNVGIGTATPGARLQIQGGGAALLVDNTALFFARNSSGVNEEFMVPRWSDNVMYINHGAGGLNIRNNANVSRMFIKPDGNVGIGAVPDHGKLDVWGPSMPANSAYIGTEPIIRLHRTVEFGVKEKVSAEIRLGSMESGILARSRLDFNLSGSPGTWNGHAIQSDITVMTLTGAGNVGIGCATPLARLHVNGAIIATSTIVPSGAACSDERYKQNVLPLNDALGSILQLRGVSYEWRRADFPQWNFAEGRQLGFIAQEVQRVLPEIVITMPDGYLAVAYDRVVPLLVNAMQQQQQHIQQLEGRLAQQASTYDARIARLEHLLAQVSAR